MLESKRLPGDEPGQESTDPLNPSTLLKGFRSMPQRPPLESFPPERAGVVELLEKPRSLKEMLGLPDEET